MVDKKRWYGIDRWSAIPQLRNGKTGYRCVFQCTLAEAYAVLSVSRVSDAPLLLALGARTAEEATALLRERGVADRAASNPWAPEAAARLIPFEPTLDFLTGWGGTKAPADHPAFLDALEANGLACLRSIRNTFWPVSQRVLAGRMRLADIREVGAARFAKAANRTDRALESLMLGEDGRPKVPASMVRSLIVKAEDATAVGLRLRAHPLDLSEVIGVEATLALTDVNRAWSFICDLQHETRYAERFERGYLADLVRFNECLAPRTTADLKASDVRMLFDSGATLRDVLRGLSEGLSLQQIAGLGEGIAPSIAGGFL